MSSGNARSSRIVAQDLALGLDHLRHQLARLGDVGLAALVRVALHARLEPLQPRAVAVAQPLHDVLGRVALELVEPFEGGLRDPHARLGRVAAVLLALLQPEPLDEHREREPGQDEREHDHGVGDEDHEVALAGSRRR